MLKISHPVCLGFIVCVSFCGQNAVDGGNLAPAQKKLEGPQAVQGSSVNSLCALVMAADLALSRISEHYESEAGGFKFCLAVKS